jgi:hypothetical protein
MSTLLSFAVVIRWDETARLEQWPHAENGV